MMKILLILTLVLGGQLLAEIDPTRPRLTIADKDGIPIEGLTESTTELSAAAKISKLPDGVYFILRPPIKIIVKHELVPSNIKPVAAPGPDQTVKEGEVVFLPCNLSYDPDGTIVKCEWKQTSGIPVEIKYTLTGEAYYIIPSSKDDLIAENKE